MAEAMKCDRCERATDFRDAHCLRTSLPPDPDMPPGFRDFGTFDYVICGNCWDAFRFYFDQPYFAGQIEKGKS